MDTACAGQHRVERGPYHLLRGRSNRLLRGWLRVLAGRSVQGPRRGGVRAVGSSLSARDVAKVVSRAAQAGARVAQIGARRSKQCAIQRQEGALLLVSGAVSSQVVTANRKIGAYHRERCANLTVLCATLSETGASCARPRVTMCQNETTTRAFGASVVEKPRTMRHG